MRVTKGVPAGHDSNAKQVMRRKANIQEVGGKGLMTKKRCDLSDEEVHVIDFDLAGSAAQPCQPK